ncbi:SHOCT domain-containing protein [Desulfocurvus sp. DL9XJH121]
MAINDVFTPLAQAHMYGGDGAGWSHMMFGQAGGWMHPFGGILMLLLVVAAGVVLFRAFGGSNSACAPTRQTPEEILKSRFARGEIGKEEYKEMLASIR